MIQISLKNITKTYFSNPVLKDINLEIKTGERIGLIGDNGTGKSTLFKIIRGEETADSGTFFIQKDSVIGYMAQSLDVLDDSMALDVLRSGQSEVIGLSEELHALQDRLNEGNPNLTYDLQKYGALSEAFEKKGGYDLEVQLDVICQGLKLNEALLNQPFSKLSGGEQARIGIGRLLLNQPDIILLDEPTNHLDFESIEWLETFLRTYKGTIVVISHDRAFLDNVIDKIFELKRGSIDVYFGNYAYYLEERLVRMGHAQKAFDQQQKEIKHIQEAAKRMREWAKQGDNEMMFKKAKAMERRIEQMDKIERPKSAEVDFNLDFKTSDKRRKHLCESQNLTLEIGEKTLLKNAVFQIEDGEKTAIIGPNGSGKSTLINAIMKGHPDIRVNPSVLFGYLPQEITFDDENANLIETYNAYHGVDANEIRKILARYAFYGVDVFKAVNTLSGGERMRLMLAILVAQNLNCLVLDEPTNHIDIRTREIVETAVSEFKGGVIFISHDRYFLENCATQMIEFYNDTLLQYQGGYEFYRSQREAKHRVVEREVLSLSQGSAARDSYEDTKNHRNALKRLKSLSEKLKVEIDVLSKALEDQKVLISTLNDDYERIVQVNRAIEQNERDLEEKMARFFDIEDDLIKMGQ